MFEGDYKIAYHLAPPMLSRRNEQGQLQKRRFGPWMRHGFALLARLKGLRGTALDIFGYTEERKIERALISEYRDTVQRILGGLTRANHAQAVDLARVPELIKGFGHVKQAKLREARVQWATREASFRHAAAEITAA